MHISTAVIQTHCINYDLYDGSALGISPTPGMPATQTAQALLLKWLNPSPCVLQDIKSQYCARATNLEERLRKLQQVTAQSQLAVGAECLSRVHPDDEGATKVPVCAPERAYAMQSRSSGTHEEELEGPLQPESLWTAPQ